MCINLCNMRPSHRHFVSVFLVSVQSCDATATRAGVHSFTYAKGVNVETVTIKDLQLKLDANGLIPAVVQQYNTGEVLMVAWMSEESLRLTFQTGTTWFWSRSRQELWNKGATSGNMQQVKRILVDCDADTLVVEVDSPGPACHTGNRSCFYRELKGE